jgi:hypothetical protein
MELPYTTTNSTAGLCKITLVQSMILRRDALTTTDNLLYVVSSTCCNSDVVVGTLGIDDSELRHAAPYVAYWWHALLYPTLVNSCL